MDCSTISRAIENQLEERRINQMYGDCGEWSEEDHDPYAEAEARWECMDGR